MNVSINVYDSRQHSVYTTVANIKIEHNKGLDRYAITSLDVPGLILAGPDLQKLLADVPAAIELLTRLTGDDDA